MLLLEDRKIEFQYNELFHFVYEIFSVGDKQLLINSCVLHPSICFKIMKVHFLRANYELYQIIFIKT